MATRRAYWKGYLKLSLVTCPVALYPASSQAEKTHFHQINRKTGNRLRQQMVDEETGNPVDNDQKGRGYEISKGKYVEIEPEELEAVEVESTHTIDIDTFVPEEEIDKRYYERPYYIVPDGKSGEEAFAVIRDAMKDKGRAALARIVFANREHIMAIEPWGKGLLGTTLRYDYEVRDEKDAFKGIPSPRVPKEMVELASHILDKKAGHFDPAKIQGRIRAGLAQASEAEGIGQDHRAGRARRRPFQRDRSHGRPAAEPGTWREKEFFGGEEKNGQGQRWAAQKSQLSREGA
jgi:DNA end-binding protein Ku